MTLGVARGLRHGRSLTESVGPRSWAAARQSGQNQATITQQPQARQPTKRHLLIAACPFLCSSGFFVAMANTLYQTGYHGPEGHRAHRDAVSNANTTGHHHDGLQDEPSPDSPQSTPSHQPGASRSPGSYPARL